MANKIRALVACACFSAFIVCVKTMAVGNERNNEPKCGVEASSNLIHHNPWLVYIEYYRGSNLWPIRCAGTLVGHRHVITAAHCVNIQFSRLVVRLGEYDTYSEVDCVRGVCADPVVRIDADFTIHPKYDGSDHDIAILTLKEDAPYTDFIRPICLPSATVSQNAVFSAAGWGEIPKKHVYSHVKKVVPLPFWEKDRCQASYQNNIVPEHVICAGGEDGVDTCRGDSGGPLTLVRDSVELAGVTSAGNTRCGTKDSPGFYTDVFYYKEWINSVIG